jgi:hypothetical protein
MVAVFRRPGRLMAPLAVTLVMAFAAPAWADNITVNVDEAQVVKLPEKVSSIVIGNPLIADAALLAGGIVVVTGKGYGTTNLMALDRNGRTIMDKNIQVSGPVASDSLVVVYRGVERETYSCSPECSPRITLGDSQNYFNGVLGQAGARTGQAQTVNTPR